MLPRRVATAGTQRRARSATRALPRAVTVARLPVLRVGRAQSEPLARPVVLAARVVRAVRAGLAGGGGPGGSAPTPRQGPSGNGPGGVPRLRGGTTTPTV